MGGEKGAKGGKGRGKGAIGKGKEEALQLKKSEQPPRFP